MAKLNEEEIKKNLTEQDFERIYNNTMQNSIGEEKQCDYNKKTKKVTLRIAFATLIIILVMTCFNNLILPEIRESIKNSIKQEENVELEYNGYYLSEIETYEYIRFSNLMAENNLTSYTQNGLIIDYNYTVEDYKKMDGLDESYLYTVYRKTNDLNEFLHVFGYNDLNDYLIKNNYVDKNGEPSTIKWRIETAKDTSEIMLNEARGR